MYQKPSSIDTAKKLPIEQDAWLLFAFDQLEVIRLHLAAGDSMENHINEWRIIFFVIRGRGTLDVEGKVYNLGQEQSIAVEAGMKRFWSNDGDQSLELLVIKSREET